jgi:hypothetical protein
MGTIMTIEEKSRASHAIAVAQVLSTQRGRLLYLPPDTEYGCGHTVWTGLIVSLSETNDGCTVEVLTPDGYGNVISTSLQVLEVEQAVAMSFGYPAPLADGEADQ